MVGPCRTAHIKGRWGEGSDYEVDRSRHTHRKRNPNPILKRAASDGMSPPPPLPSRLCRFSDAPLPHHHAVHWRPRGCIQGGIGVHAVVAVKLRKVVEPNYGSTGETQRYQFYDSNNYNKKLMKLLVRQGGGQCPG